MSELDQTDRALIRATQAGLPLDERPYHRVGTILGITAEEVMERLTRLLETGAIRRIGVVPNHYALGYRFNPQFTDDTAACMVLSDTIFAMLLTHEKFQQFTPASRSVADGKATTEVLLGLSADSKAEVDQKVDAAIEAALRPRWCSRRHPPGAGN